MSLRVLEPGLQSLLVDRGRPHSRSLGVSVGGAADRWSLALGNALVGNSPNQTALEIAIAGPTLQADADVAGIVFGAPFEVSSDRQQLTANKSFNLCAGEIVRVRGCRQSMRAYLCVAGGFSSPMILDSHSALTSIQVGQPMACSSKYLPSRSIHESALASLRIAQPQILRFLPGAQASWFDMTEFTSQSFTTTPASNRMGIRLRGKPLTRPKREMISEPVCPGTVQVTNDGQCILLGVDGQTIGGYPKIAQIISADLDCLAQIRPGETVHFAQVSLNEAENAWHHRAAALETWLQRITLVVSV
jgi:antagonist of KipI